MRKYLLFLLLNLLAALGASAQNLDSAIIKSVRDALYLIRVDYVLEDTATKDRQRYVRDGKPYFGRVIGLAFDAQASPGKDEIWFDQHLTKPWLYFDESNYSLFKDDATLRPVISDVGIRPIYGRSFLPCIEIVEDFKDSLQIINTPVCDTLAPYIESTIMMRPYTIKDTSVVLLYASLAKDQNIANDNVKVNLSVIYPGRIKLLPNKKGFQFTNIASLNPLGKGGISLFPHVSGMGQITFQTNGIARYNIDKLQWQVMPLPLVMGAPIQVKPTNTTLTPRDPSQRKRWFPNPFRKKKDNPAPPPPVKDIKNRPVKNK